MFRFVFWHGLFLNELIFANGIESSEGECSGL